MADTAAHLVDRVLPRAPYRQWGFTVPKPLRLVLARDPAWTSWIGGLVVRAIGAWQRRVARKPGIRSPLTGAVPTNANVLAILDRIMRQLARRLAKDATTGELDEDAAPDLLAQVQAEAASTWRSPTEMSASSPVRGAERLRAWCEGFSMHAGVVIAEHPGPTAAPAW